jgi:SMI1 / KNR4 family (SUKH-1)
MAALKSSQILDLLDQLSSKRNAIFGAESHSFKLRGVLTEDAVFAFEQRHKVRLPEDYRQFLIQVGNGGAGPFYGVFPLGFVDDNFNLREWHKDDDPVGNLGEPFCFNQAWNDLSIMPEPDLLDHDEAEYYRLQKSFEEAYWSSCLVNGAIPICHEGCAIRVLLIVSGNQAGRLWEDRRSEYQGLGPLILKDGSPAGFGEWYSEWLRGCMTVTEI